MPKATFQQRLGPLREYDWSCLNLLQNVVWSLNRKIGLALSLTTAALV